MHPVFVPLIGGIGKKSRKGLERSAPCRLEETDGSTSPWGLWRPFRTRRQAQRRMPSTTYDVCRGIRRGDGSATFPSPRPRGMELPGPQTHPWSNQFRISIGLSVVLACPHSPGFQPKHAPQSWSTSRPDGSDPAARRKDDMVDNLPTRQSAVTPSCHFRSLN